MPVPPLRRLTAATLIALALPFTSALHAAATEWAPNVTTTAAWHDNANNALSSADQLDSLQLNADLLSSNDYKLGPTDTLRATAHLGGDYWPRYRKLLTGTAGGRAGWLHAFGPAPTASTLSLEVGADALYSGERARNGTTSFALAAFRHRLNSETRLTLQHELARHDARHAVYDRTSNESSIELGYDPSPKSRLTLTARYRTGDLVSYAATPSAELVSITRVSAVTDTFDRPLVASSIDARTWSTRLAYLRAFDDSSAIIVAYELRQNRASPVRFTNNILSVALVHQF